jgi:hypothetical protein
MLLKQKMKLLLVVHMEVYEVHIVLDLEQYLSKNNYRSFF